MFAQKKQQPERLRVLITGGSRGLGLAMARHFSSLGARLILCARDPYELRRARLSLREQGAEVSCFVCDLTRPGQVKRLATAVQHRYGGIDVLINNAGIIEA